MTTRNGSHLVSKIVNALDANIKRILMLIHSFSGCDTVSSIHGFGKVTILKKAVSFHDEGHLASLLSMRVSTNEVITAGPHNVTFSFIMHTLLGSWMSF